MNKIFPILSFTFFSIVFLGCKEDTSALCHCTDQIIIENAEGIYEIPNDLTTITYTRGTNDDLITESIKLLNKLNETRFSVEDSLEVFSELETQIESWLGGPKKGECGNLFNGIILSQGNWLSKKGQISIQSYNMTPTLFQAKTSESEMAKVYQADIKFKIKAIESQKSIAESSIIGKRLLVRTCRTYTIR